MLFAAATEVCRGQARLAHEKIPPTPGVVEEELENNMLGLAAYASDSDKEDESPALSKEESEEKPAKRARVGDGSDAVGAAPVLPPEPEGEADPALTKRLADWRASGFNPTQQIRQNREFANPQILQKIVEYFSIDDIGSCYPTHIFDPQAIVARRAKEKPAPAD